jgi:hypothetical protein
MILLSDGTFHLRHSGRLPKTPLGDIEGGKELPQMMVRNLSLSLVYHRGTRRLSRLKLKA